MCLSFAVESGWGACGMIYGVAVECEDSKFKFFFVFFYVFVFRWFPAVGPESDEGVLGRETGSKPEVPRKFFSAGRAGGFQKVPQKPNHITKKTKLTQATSRSSVSPASPTPKNAIIQK